MEKITQGHPMTQSPDFVKENIELLKSLFPTIVKEGKIDWSELQALLSNEIETEDEYYRLTWAGKSMARKEANKPSTATLRPNKADSKDWDTTQNIFIEGDNLEVLKLLQKSYTNKIKMIYIDPPYNTGGDFVYKDNYADNLTNYLTITGQLDDSGKRTSTNTESDGRYHSNWLNMLYPRLKLVRNLMTEDGVIFISIDDNEVTNLRKVCDEIFGEDNFLNLISVKAKPSSGASGGGEDKKLKKNVEYLMCYTNNRQSFTRFNDIWEVSDLFEFIETYKEEGKSWKYTRILQSFGNKTFFTETVDGSGEVIKIFKHENVVIKTISEVSIQEKLTIEETYFKYFDKIFRDTNAQSSIRQRVIDSTDEDDTFYSIEYIPKSGRNKAMLTTLYYKGRNKDLIAWLSDVAFKENDKLIKRDKLGTLWTGFNWNNISKEGAIKYPNGKKPIDLIKRLIELTSSESKDDIILDFFAGSGSTAHAVMDKNLTDNGIRKSISIQLPEKISEKDKKENYSDVDLQHIENVCDVWVERIKRAGEKLNQQVNPDLFSTNNKPLDVGFKAFKLDSSNIKAWDGNPENLETNLFNAGNNIKEYRTEEDVLFEILLKNGLDLVQPIEQKFFAGKTVFNVGVGTLFICLAEGVTTEVAEGIGQWKKELDPATCKVIFKDNGFTDVEKTNSMQILKRYGIEEVNTI